MNESAMMTEVHAEGGRGEGGRVGKGVGEAGKEGGGGRGDRDRSEIVIKA